MGNENDGIKDEGFSKIPVPKPDKANDVTVSMEEVKEVSTYENSAEFLAHMLGAKFKKELSVPFETVEGWIKSLNLRIQAINKEIQIYKYFKLKEDPNTNSPDNSNRIPWDWGARFLLTVYILLGFVGMGASCTVIYFMMLNGNIDVFKQHQNITIVMAMLPLTIVVGMKSIAIKAPAWVLIAFWVIFILSSITWIGSISWLNNASLGGKEAVVNGILNGASGINWAFLVSSISQLVTEISGGVVMFFHGWKHYYTYNKKKPLSNPVYEDYTNKIKKLETAKSEISINRGELEGWLEGKKNALSFLQATGHALLEKTLRDRDLWS